MPTPDRIDVHHHIDSPGYIEELRSLLLQSARSIEHMERAGVTTAITSVAMRRASVKIIAHNWKRLVSIVSIYIPSQRP
jgi:hypothetical protein